MDAVTLANKIRSKELSPVEVADAVLERIHMLDPTLHAFSTLAVDQARQDASRTERAIMSGEDVGPLAGVPIGMKDLFFVKGIRTTFAPAANRPASAALARASPDIVRASRLLIFITGFLS